MPQSRNLFYMATGTTEYPSDYPPLPSVAADLEQITGILEELGYQNALPELPRNPSRDVLIGALEDWFTSSERKPDDEAVFYYSGHGETRKTGDRHYLVLKNEKGRCASEDIFRAIAEKPIAQRVLVIIDTCYSGQATVDIGKILEPFEQGLDQAGCYVNMVTSSRSRQEAATSAFTPALVKALRNDDGQWGGRNQERISLPALMKAILAGIPKWQDTKVDTFPATKTGSTEFSFPNKGYVPGLAQGLDLESQRNTIERKTHWDPRVRYFTGRTAVLDKINAWLAEKTSGGKAVVVTGGPGTGKSAILARLVTDRKTNIALHARGKTVSQATDILARASGVVLPKEDEIDAKTRAELLASEIAGQQRKIVIAIDALDESKQPREIASTLLTPLLRSESVWLVVGTRPDSTSEHRFRALGSATIEIDLDEGANIGAEDMETYVNRRLAASGEEPPQTAYRVDEALRRQAAKSIAARAGRNFLIARLTCDRLLRDTRNPATERPWEVVRDADVGAEFEAYLRRFDEVPRWSRQRIVDLLEPLAYAQGQGLPWEQLWSPIARSMSGAAYTDSDIRELLTEAAPYLLESLEDGRSVYRLFHEALAEHLRGSAESSEKNRRMANALRDSVARRPDGGPDWLKAHPYALRYLAIHACKGGTLDDLATDPLFLVAAVPAGLKYVLTQCSSEEGRRWAAVYSIAAHDLGDDLGERVSCLHLAACKLREFLIADAIAALPVPGRWRVRASNGKRITPHWSLEGHSSSVASVALGQRHGRQVIVSGSWDSTLRVWDLETLEPLGAPLEGHSDMVQSVAVGQRQGRAVIVSGSRDKTARVWDLETLEPVGAPLEGHTNWVQSVAVGQRQGRAVIVSGSDDRTVRVWDLETLEPVGAPLDGHSSGVESVAVGQRQSRMVIVSGSSDHTIRVWDLETLEAVGAPLEGHSDIVQSVAVGQRQRRAVIVSGSKDDTVRLWDLETLQPVGTPLMCHSVSVQSASIGHRQDRAVIVSGSLDRTVRVWDLETLEPVSAPLEGHSSLVSSVVVGQRQGRAVIVSGSSDQTVRVWDLETLAPAGARLEGDSNAVQSVAVGQRQGRAVIVSASWDRTVRLWDLETLEPVGAPLEGHFSAVQSVAVGQRKGRAVIVSGSWDRTVRLWDLETLDPLGSSLKGLSGFVESVAVGQGQGRAVIVSGSWDQTVRVWDLETLEPVGAPLEGHSDWVQAVAVGQRQGRAVIVSGSKDYTVRVWDLETQEPVGAPLKGHSHWVKSVAAGQRQGRAVIVSGSLDRTVRVWDLETLELVGAPLEGHSGEVHSVALEQLQGRAVIVSADAYKTVYVWDLDELRPLMRIVLGTPCRSVVVVDGGLVVGTEWGLLRIALP